ncbi:hypothetical protein L208DRAFT_1383682 [Tricholoma matsutake]|nr:hypothetical protein L208DRAFT_1383682 [Tricholoma matsutake 945]
MNPTFKPPPPVSDAVKTAIYEAFMQDPIKNNVRSLSQIHHLSLKRVDAILRLKGMENAWIKVTVYSMVFSCTESSRQPFEIF